MKRQKAKPPAQQGDIEEYVLYTIKAREEAYAECADLPETDRAWAANMAWRCVLPTLDGVQAAKAFIACIAVGQSRGWLTSEESRGLAYTAQLALSVWGRK
jgi:hypothetical protein